MFSSPAPYAKKSNLPITITLPSDYHWHARQGTLFSRLYKHTTRRCSRALLMPNTVPGYGLNGPIADVHDLDAYYKIVKRRMYPCVPLMTIKLLKTTTPETIKHCFAWGAIAAKLYPCGATTHAQDGIPIEWLEVKRFASGLEEGGSTGRLLSPNQNFLDVIGQMEKLNMVLCLHGEIPKYPSYVGRMNAITAISAFLDFVDFLVYNYPKLRIVLEHISTAQEVELVKTWHNLRNGKVIATVTPHHTHHTVNEVVGHPYNYCRPPAQYFYDRNALIEFVTSGHSAAVCGTDSAAHPRSKKECVESCAGVFNAPVFVEHFVGLFEKHDALKYLSLFLTRNGDEFYGQRATEQTIRIERRTWTVPQDFQGLRPFRAKEILHWAS